MDRLTSEKLETKISSSPNKGRLGGVSVIRNCFQLKPTPTLPNQGGRLAFTLAEVLITLGVIGVIAAMTMPVLIKNYKSIVLRSQFTKAYSSFAQATQKIFMEDFGGVNDFENSSVADLLVLYQKHMKKAVKCDRYDVCPEYIFPKSYI